MENKRKRERERKKDVGFFVGKRSRENSRKRGYAWISLTRGLILEAFDTGLKSGIGTLSLLEAFDLGDGYNEKLRGGVGNEVSLPG